MSTPYQPTEIVRKFRGALVSVGVFSFFFNMLVLTLPLYMLSVFTRVLSSKSEETLLLLTMAAIIGLFLQALLDMIRGRLMARVAVGLDAAMAPQVLEAVIRNAAGSGTRNTQPIRDATEVRGFLSGSGVFSLFDAPFAPLYVLIIYLLHPLLGTIALFGALALFGIAVAHEISTRKSLKDLSTHAGTAQAKVDEFARNADAIEAMGMMPTILNRWQSQTGYGVAALSGVVDKSTLANSFAKFVRFSLQISIFGAGSYLYILNEIQAGVIIAAAILMGRALAPVESAIGTWKNFVSAKAAYERLRLILTPERFSRHRDRMALPRPEGQIELERVVVTIPNTERLILKGVSLTLKPGEFLGIVGPSGAGKSTLAKVLVGIITPRGGTGARLDGADLAVWNPDDLGQYIGYLPQDVQLFPGTVRENISRLTEGSDPEAVIQAAKRAGVHDIILKLPDGYDTDIGDSGRFLSAGQRQHIGLARAFYGDPVLLVLDEPNSNLDAASESALGKALVAAKERGTTIIVITHRPNIVGASDQLLLLKDGTVELYGPSEEVMARMRPKALPDERRAEVADNRDGQVTGTAASDNGAASSNTANDAPVGKIGRQRGAGSAREARRARARQGRPMGSVAKPASVNQPKQKQTTSADPQSKPTAPERPRKAADQASQTAARQNTPEPTEDSAPQTAARQQTPEPTADSAPQTAARRSAPEPKLEPVQERVSAVAEPSAATPQEQPAAPATGNAARQAQTATRAKRARSGKVRAAGPQKREATDKTTAAERQPDKTTRQATANEQPAPAQAAPTARPAAEPPPTDEAVALRTEVKGNGRDDDEEVVVTPQQTFEPGPRSARNKQASQRPARKSPPVTIESSIVRADKLILERERK